MVKRKEQDTDYKASARQGKRRFEEIYKLIAM
jgi:hypothetical protein